MDTIELSGITLPSGNKCHKGECSNDSCTAVWINRIQHDLCGWHLKELVEYEM